MSLHIARPYWDANATSHASLRDNTIAHDNCLTIHYLSTAVTDASSCRPIATQMSLLPPCLLAVFLRALKQGAQRDFVLSLVVDKRSWKDFVHFVLQHPSRLRREVIACGKTLGNKAAMV